jgi:transcriptional regulator with XRE-family HTH domain
MAIQKVRGGGKVLNNKLLRSKLLEKGITIKQLAKELNVSPQGLNKRILKNKLYISDVFHICKKLDLPFENIFKEI